MPNQIMQLKASVQHPVEQIEAMKIIKEMSALKNNNNKMIKICFFPPWFVSFPAIAILHVKSS